MAELTRYDAGFDNDLVKPHVCGKFVLYAEYLSVKRQLDTLLARYAFQENQRLCVGYGGGCDGDLEAIEHNEGCPAREHDLTLRPHLYLASADESKA